MSLRLRHVVRSLRPETDGQRAHPRKHAKQWLDWPWTEDRVMRDAAAVCFTAEEERRREGGRVAAWLEP